MLCVQCIYSWCCHGLNTSIDPRLSLLAVVSRLLEVSSEDLNEWGQSINLLSLYMLIEGSQDHLLRNFMIRKSRQHAK